MKTFGIICSILILCSCSAVTSNVEFEDYFKNETMRVDYFHHGKHDTEHFSIDRVLNDGPWSGSLTQLVDELEFGLYFFEVKDLETDKLLYSRGYASIFGEWQTIPEAKERWGTFHESIRFPWPVNPVKLLINKRNAENKFEVIWETTIDPSLRAVNKAPKPSQYSIYDIMVNGNPNEKVDVVILGDGYTADEMEKFHADAERLNAELFKVEPFKTRMKDFNVRAVETPSQTSGVNKPHPGVYDHSALSMSYSSFDSERYALSYDNRTIRDAAAEVPYEFMFVLINERTYGGGGIYRLYATVASDNSFSDYIHIHEFGHHFAALADEYYTSSVSYEVGEVTMEPWEANVTALFDPENIKWKELVEPGTPIPTPWDKETYDEFSMGIQKERKELRAAKVDESVVEALFNRERKESSAILENMEYSGKVGAFEGGNYQQFGIYRSSADCIMFTRNHNDFCPVCQHTIEKVIDQYIK